MKDKRHSEDGCHVIYLHCRSQRHLSLSWMEGPSGYLPSSRRLTEADSASVISNLHLLCWLFKLSDYLLFELKCLINKALPPRGPRLIGSHWIRAKYVENLLCEHKNLQKFMLPSWLLSYTSSYLHEPYRWLKIAFFSNRFFQDNYNCGMHDGPQEVSPRWTELHTGDWELWVECSDWTADCWLTLLAGMQAILAQKPFYSTLCRDLLWCNCLIPEEGGVLVNL